ncbi:unnamed protein product [Adineta ricciae]|uniref:Uncharacterized protein n=1 Tax=Adineta ricciae TaxID=249248 RepID=A0A814D607_ADIRI|nr:unnamed protein product [Adineta ricciae]
MDHRSKRVKAMNYKPFMVRLRQFLSPKQGVHSNIAMRAAGFSYTGNADTARCDTCALEVSNWTLNMKPFTIHAQRSPKCEFVRSRQPSDITTLSPIHATIQCTSSSPSHDEDRPSKRQKIDPPLASMCSNTWVETETLKEIRRRTFSHWPKRSSPSVEHMIEAGFFSCNIGDRVICIYCNIICQQWMQYTDDPREVHRILSPQCPFVRFISSHHLPSLSNNDDPCEPKSGMLEGASHRAYAHPKDRHASFKEWSTERLPSVDDLVNAGFFYSGMGSLVTCFYCNGSLQNWGPADNPKVEHARWFPHCAYAKHVCGKEFYQKVQDAVRRNEKSKARSKFGVQETTTATAPVNTSSETLDSGVLERLVAARLDLPYSRRLLDQNFRLSIIKRCWEDQLLFKGDDFHTETDLFVACMILQKQIEIIAGKAENIIVPSERLKKLSANSELGILLNNS